MTLDLIGQYIVSGITMGSIYAIVAIGFTSTFNTSGILNFAQGEFVMLGGLTSITLVNFGVPAPLAFLAAVAIVPLVGVGFERLVINPRRKAPFLILVQLCLAGSFLFKGAARLTMGIYDLSLAPIFPGAQDLLGVKISNQSLAILTFAALAGVALWYFLNKTSLGKAMRAAKDNQIGAMLSGINTETLIISSWIISGFLGAVAGILIAPITMMGYQTGGDYVFNAIAAVTVGGFGSNLGALLGGYIVGLSQQTAAAVISPVFKEVVSFLLIIIVLTIKPNGLLGKPIGNV